MIQAYAQRGVDARYRVDSLGLFLTRRSDHLAYAITRYRSTNGSRKDMGVSLVVLRNTGDNWLIVAYEPAVADPTAAIQTLGPNGISASVHGESWWEILCPARPGSLVLQFLNFLLHVEIT